MPVQPPGGRREPADPAPTGVPNGELTPGRSHALQRARRSSPLPGLLLVAAGVAVAMLLHRVVGSVGVLTSAVLVGALLANTGALPVVTRPGLDLAAKKFLRVGIVLLGLSLSVVSIADLGLPLLAMVTLTLLVTFLVTIWAGRLLGVGRARSLLIATGFAVCGASAVAAMQDNAEADEDDVAAAIAMVTLWGTLTMLTLPLLQVPLGLDNEQLGIWAGASVHEVGQVVAAAGPAGAAAVAVAVVVKLTRVLLLAPLVIGVNMLRARPGGRTTARPPLMPLFVLGFLACVALRSTGMISEPLLAVAAEMQTVALTAAMFALGTGVHLLGLLRRGTRALALGAVSTAVVALVALTWVHALV